jgi:N-acetylglucosaminyldiphosphoundecaprenol N-acetyl-beta-D-mannosaminyltransferase
MPKVKIAMGIGGAFNFIAGIKKRAPKLIQKIGLEWLYRLIQEPKRIKRIYNAVIKFPIELLFKAPRHD